MPSSDVDVVGYVLKRYPRYSETFVVNEILAHEAAGQPLHIFSLRYPEDGHFQDSIARVRAPVTYLPAAGLRGDSLWSAVEEAAELEPGVWSALRRGHGCDPRHVYQALRLVSEARRLGVRHLHAHFATEATTVARLASCFAGIPYSFTAHAKDIFHEDVQPDDLRRKLEDAHTAVTVSDFNRSFLQGSHPGSGMRLQRIYNGLDLQRFPYRELTLRPPRIAAVGRLVEKKGFGDLVEACGILARRGVDFRCDLIGSGPLEAELRRGIERLQLGERVRLLGPRPQAEVVDAMATAAVFAAPCVVGDDGNRDGLPTVLLEAMALGTPCVSTAVTGIPEAIEHRRTGILVPERDPLVLAAALEELLGDATLRSALAAAARRRIELEFDVERNSESLRRIFCDAMAGRAALARSA